MNSNLPESQMTAHSMTDSVGGGGTKPGEGGSALAGDVLDADIAAELARSPRIEGYVFGALLLMLAGLGVYALLSMTLSGG